MICKRIELGDGNFAIACFRGRRLAPCSVPGCSDQTANFCDFPVTRKGERAPCNFRLCARHSKEIGANQHVCPAHAKLPFPGGEQPRLPGMG